MPKDAELTAKRPDPFTNGDWIADQRRLTTERSMDYQGYLASEFYDDDSMAEALLELHLAHVTACKAIIQRMDHAFHRKDFAGYIEALDAAYTDDLRGSIAALKHGMDCVADEVA